MYVTPLPMVLMAFEQLATMGLHPTENQIVAGHSGSNPSAGYAWDHFRTESS